MYIKDGENKDYSGRSIERCYSWGWLTSERHFKTGWEDLSEKQLFLTKLKTLPVVDIHRGQHTDEGLGLTIGCGIKSNGLIKFRSKNVLYIAPVSVIYYIEKLNYIPPEEVIDAIIDNVYTTEITNSFNSLQQIFQEDSTLTWSFHRRVAASIIDTIHIDVKSANKAAAYIMFMLFNVDTSKHEYYNF